MELLFFLSRSPSQAPASNSRTRSDSSSSSSSSSSSDSDSGSWLLFSFWFLFVFSSSPEVKQIFQWQIGSEDSDESSTASDSTSSDSSDSSSSSSSSSSSGSPRPKKALRREWHAPGSHSALGPQEANRNKVKTSLAVWTRPNDRGTSCLFYVPWRGPMTPTIDEKSQGYCCMKR